MALRYGNVTQIDPEKGLAKVEFAEDGIESAWLSPLVSKTKADKFYHMFDIGEHVACLMDENAEEGCILGAVYSSKNMPGPKGKDIWGVQFSDGSTVTFDRASGTLTVDTKGDITVKTAKNTTVEASQTILIKAAQGVTIEADTEIKGQLTVIGGIQGNGDLSLQGQLSADGEISSQSDVRVGPISLVTHKHPTAVNGPPSTPIP